MVSIIIPAYNEEAVIGNTLRFLLQGATVDDMQDLEVIVCCNGCKDRTAEIAQQFGAPVRVLQTSQGSKTIALNMGDAAAKSFPRIYLDADVLLDFSAVKCMVKAFEETSVLAVAPRMKADLTHSSWLVRAFYDIWLQTPYHLHGMIGSGVYALSKEGRGRFGEFPETFADDSFVRAHFTGAERKTLDDCFFTMSPPVNFSTLVQIKTRATWGNKDLFRKQTQLMQQFALSEKAAGQNFGIWNLALKPNLWAKLAVYVYVKAIASIRANAQIRRMTTSRWDRDETTRR